jgi:hypothetical protein
LLVGDPILFLTEDFFVELLQLEKVSSWKNLLTLVFRETNSFPDPLVLFSERSLASLSLNGTGTVIGFYFFLADAIDGLDNI